MVPPRGKQNNEMSESLTINSREQEAPIADGSSDISESRGTWRFEITGRNDHLEYNIVDVDERPEVPLSSTEDSEEEDINEIAQLGAVAAAVSHEWEDNLDADTSSTCSTSPSSNSDVDPGLPRSDYNEFWNCAQCKQENENSNYQLCFKCHVMRKNFFPPRRLKRRRRRSVLNARKRTQAEIQSCGEGVSEKSSKKPRLEQESQESGIESSSQNSTLSVDQVDGPVTENTQQQGAETELCCICCVNPRNGLFVHGKSAHSNFCCHKCAFKTWKSIGCCPLCRKKVRQVLKLV